MLRPADEEEGTLRFSPRFPPFLRTDRAHHLLDDMDIKRPDRAPNTRARALAKNRDTSPLSPPPTSPPRATREAKTNARGRLSRDFVESEDESELSELEEEDNLEIELDAGSSTKKTKAKGKAKPKKKAKGKKKSQSKGKAKAKGKGKGKGRARLGTSSDSEEEEEPKPKGKKQLVAKAAYWDDIPDWGESDRCQLLEMPTEILDMMFGLRPELRVGHRTTVQTATLTKVSYKSTSRWLEPASFSDIIWMSHSFWRSAPTSEYHFNHCLVSRIRPTRQQNDLSVEMLTSGGFLARTRRPSSVARSGPVDHLLEFNRSRPTINLEANELRGRNRSILFTKRRRRITSQSSGKRENPSSKCSRRNYWNGKQGREALSA